MTAYRSPQEWSNIVTAYENRNVTQAQFCQDYEISPASLNYHRRKLAKKEVPSLVELPNSSLGLLNQPSECRLEFDHPVFGRLKVSCGAGQLGEIVDQLSISF